MLSCLLPLVLTSSVGTTIYLADQQEKNMVADSNLIILSSLWSTTQTSPTTCSEVKYVDGLNYQSPSFLYSQALANIKSGGELDATTKSYFTAAYTSSSGTGSNLTVNFTVTVQNWASSYVDGSTAYLSVNITTENKISLRSELNLLPDQKLDLTVLKDNDSLRTLGYYSSAQNYGNLRTDLKAKFNNLSNPNQITFTTPTWSQADDMYLTTVSAVPNSTVYNSDTFVLRFNYKRVVLGTNTYNVDGSTTRTKLSTTLTEFVSNPTEDNVETAFKNANKNFFLKNGQTDANLYNGFVFTFGTPSGPDDPTSAANNGKCLLEGLTGSEDYTVNVDSEHELEIKYTVKIKPNLIDNVNINVHIFPTNDTRDTLNGDIWSASTYVTVGQTISNLPVIQMVQKPVAADIRWFLITYDTTGPSFITDGTNLNTTLNWNEIDITIPTNAYGTAVYSTRTVNVYEVTLNAKTGSLVYTPTTTPIKIYVLVKY